MNAKERYLLKLNVARLYYIEKRTQVEIADELGISRPTLIKLLKEAADEGIVRIEVVDVKKMSELGELEDRLKSALCLRDVKVADVQSDSAEAINSAVGREAAEYFKELVKSNMRVGIGWGRTIEVMSRQLETIKSARNVSFIPVMGGPGSSEDCTMFANNLCERIAAKVSGSGVDYIYAPFFVTDPMMRNAYISLPNIKAALSKLDSLDIAVIGIDGDYEHSTTLEVDKAIAKALSGCDIANIAGNICAHFFDRNGYRIAPELDDNIIAITPEQLKRIPTVVGAAGGRYKAGSIIGAARGGLCNIIITDAFTAERILSAL